MKLCLIGKYFPIEGGVSRDNQWLATILAQAGWQVHVVTNASEVEPQYRCLSPVAISPPDCSGSISIHTTDQAQRRHYIPYANPFVTKLASIATEVVRTYQCELIYSYYLEPYSVAAFLASRWTGVAYGLRTAGSDIGSLFQSPELQTAYREVIQGADYLVATPATYRSFLHLGVAPDKLYLPAGVSLPPDVFSPSAVPLDVNATLAWMHNNLGADPYYDVFRRFLHKSFRPDVATIGIYGKVGVVKGSFDLLTALGQLQREGVVFQLLVLTGGSSSLLTAFATSVEEHGLSNVTWLLPFLPHRSVPQFIRACSAICCLERDFPYPIHTPLLPQEVIACGTCLVLSHEIAEKQSFREHLQHGTNIFLVDPRNYCELATILRTMVTDPELCQRIGQRGLHDLLGKREELVGTMPRWQRLFAQIYEDVQQRRHAMSLAEMQAYLARLYTDDAFRKLWSLAPDASFETYLLTETEKQALRAIDHKLVQYFASSLKMKQQEHLHSVYPATFALPEALVQRLFNRFYHDYPAHPHEDALTRIMDFGLFMQQALAVDEQAPCYGSEVAKYERFHYLYLYQPMPEDALTAINAPRPSKAVPLQLTSVPAILPGVYRETFVYPIVSLVDALRKQQSVEEQALHPGRYNFVFQREVHSLTLSVFALNAETSLLLDLCQQGHTVAMLIEMVEQQLGETGLADDILAMLSMLREKQIIGVQHEP